MRVYLGRRSIDALCTVSPSLLTLSLGMQSMSPTKNLINYLMSFVSHPITTLALGMQSMQCESVDALRITTVALQKSEMCLD